MSNVILNVIIEDTVSKTQYWISEIIGNRVMCRELPTLKAPLAILKIDVEKFFKVVGQMKQIQDGYVVLMNDKLSSYKKSAKNIINKKIKVAI